MSEIIKMTYLNIAPISLDLDDLWTYWKTREIPEWRSLPTFLDLVIPRLLNIFRDKGITITVFVVGLDATLERNYHLLRQISQAGHEIGNHSFNHDPWLTCYDTNKIEEEIVGAEDAIVQIIEKRPVGFRGPGFSISDSLCDILSKRGYLYDASVFSTFITPLARLYYFWNSSLTPEQCHQRRHLNGHFLSGFGANRPYLREKTNHQILEIPVTTLPFLRIPFHVSYLQALHAYSLPLAKSYFTLALSLCRATNNTPSLLFHPTDLLGIEDNCNLSFFPGMNLNVEQKLSFIDWLLDEFKKYYEPVALQEYAHKLI